MASSRKSSARGNAKSVDPEAIDAPDDTSGDVIEAEAVEPVEDAAVGKPEEPAEQPGVERATEADPASEGHGDTPPAEEPVPGEGERRETERHPARAMRPLGSLAALVLGGILAAVVGFAAARYVVPDGWPFPGTVPEEDPVTAALALQAGEIARLQADLQAQQAAVADLQADTSLDDLRGALVPGLDELSGRITALSARIDEIEGRVLNLEKQPSGGGAEAARTAARAYERELAAMRAMLDEELARLKAAQEDAQVLESSAAETARAAAARAAVSRLVTELRAGRPYSDALFDLRNSTDLTIPDVLNASAGEGVATLAALQEAFPPAARAALDASIRAGVEDGSIDRVSAFLRTQLGARSLEPRAGDDPDAVLSRAEAALKSGDVAAALAELAAMPAAAEAALADWKAAAQAQSDAIAAALALADQLNAR